MPQALYRSIDRGRRAVGLADVADDNVDLAALRLDLPRDARSGLLIPVGDDDPRSVGGEPHRGRRADRATAAGDDRDLANETRGRGTHAPPPYDRHERDGRKPNSRSPASEQIRLA